ELCRGRTQHLPYLVPNRLAPILFAVPIFGSDPLDQRFQRGPVHQRIQPNLPIFHPNFKLFAFPQVALFEYCLRDANRLTVSPLHKLCLGACHSPYPSILSIYTCISMSRVSHSASWPRILSCAFGNIVPRELGCIAVPYRPGVRLDPAFQARSPGWRPMGVAAPLHRQEFANSATGLHPHRTQSSTSRVRAALCSGSRDERLVSSVTSLPFLWIASPSK